MRKLTINNFGPILNAELELKAVNLLIGEQSIGKSTIAKLITIMTDIFSLGMIVRTGHIGWIDQLRTYGLDIYSKDDYRIQYELIENDIHLTQTITKEDASTSFTKGKNVITDTEKASLMLFELKYLSSRAVQESSKSSDKRSEWKSLKGSTIILTTVGF